MEDILDLGLLAVWTARSSLPGIEQHMAVSGFQTCDLSPTTKAAQVGGGRIEPGVPRSILAGRMVIIQHHPA